MPAKSIITCLLHQSSHTTLSNISSTISAILVLSTIALPTIHVVTSHPCGSMWSSQNVCCALPTHTPYPTLLLSQVQGRGGHAAIPHATVNPVIAAASTVAQLRSLVTTSLPPYEPVRVMVLCQCLVTLLCHPWVPLLCHKPIQQPVRFKIRLHLHCPILFFFTDQCWAEKTIRVGSDYLVICIFVCQLRHHC